MINLHVVLVIIISIVLINSIKMKTIVAVGSKNPVKINSARQGIMKAFQLNDDDINVIGFNSPSHVPDQPIGDEQTKLGAINRAKAAYSTYVVENNGVNPTFSVGLEGGIQVDKNEDMECFAWMVIFDGKKIGSARTCSFVLPKAISTLVLSGMELGDADDAVFGVKNNKQKGGTVGHLTKGVIDRTLYYEQAIILASIPFLHEDLYH